MKKIYAGILSIVAVLTIVGASAYALYSSTVTVTGVVLGTATTGLTIQAKSSGQPFSDAYTELPLNGWLAKPLYPSQWDWGHIKLNNASDPSMPLNITARLTNADGDWNELKDVLLMRVVKYIDDATTHADGASTSWKTLAEWNAAPQNLPANPIAGDASQEYWIEVYLPDSANSNTAGKTITNIRFEIIGTQAE